MTDERINQILDNIGHNGNQQVFNAMKQVARETEIEKSLLIEQSYLELLAAVPGFSLTESKHEAALRILKMSSAPLIP